jgi:hypothetical protein
MARQAPNAVLRKEEKTAPLSPTRAFVVQFRTNSGPLTGRAEHLASGEAVLFANKNELFEFFERTLISADSASKK